MSFPFFVRRCVCPNPSSQNFPSSQLCAGGCSEVQQVRGAMNTETKNNAWQARQAPGQYGGLGTRGSSAFGQRLPWLRGTHGVWGSPGTAWPLPRQQGGAESWGSGSRGWWGLPLQAGKQALAAPQCLSPPAPHGGMFLCVSARTFTSAASRRCSDLWISARGWFGSIFLTGTLKY